MRDRHYTESAELGEKISAAGLEKGLERHYDKDGFYVEFREYGDYTEYDSDIDLALGFIGRNPVWDQLDADDQAATIRYANLLEAKRAAWRIDGEEPGHNMFGLPEAVKKIKAEEADFGVLSGLFAYEVAQKGRVKLERYEELGFASKLDMLASLAGHIVVNKDLRFSDRNPTMKTDTHPGVQKVTTIGGDMHGDFFIAQDEEYPNGAIDPIGNRQLFAPKEELSRLHAYHSVEPYFVMGLFYWADSLDIPEADQIAMWQRAIEGAVEGLDTGPFVARTAEQVGGVDNHMNIMNVEIYKSREEEEIDPVTNAEGYHNRPYFMNMGGHYQGTGIEMMVSPEGQFVMLPATSIKNEQALPFEERLRLGMAFDEREMEGLMRLIIEQSASAQGRTPANNLIGMVQARFSSGQSTD